LEGHHAVVQELLKHSRFILPDDVGSIALMYACERGHTEVVRELIELCSSKAHESALVVASRHGHKPIVNMLMNVMSASAEALNDAFQIACSNGNYKVAKKLIDQVDPTLNHNLALRYAASIGHFKLCCLLMSHPAVNPSDQNNEALKTALRNEDTDIVTLLLRDTRVALLHKVKPKKIEEKLTDVPEMEED